MSKTGTRVRIDYSVPQQNLSTKSKAQRKWKDERPIQEGYNRKMYFMILSLKKYSYSSYVPAVTYEISITTSLQLDCTYVCMFACSTCTGKLEEIIVCIYFNDNFSAKIWWPRNGDLFFLHYRNYHDGNQNVHNLAVITYMKSWVRDCLRAG